LTAVIALIVVLPHGLWFLDHLDAATGRTIGKLTAEETSSRLSQIMTGLSSLALAFAGFASLTLVLFAIVFGRDMMAAWKASSPWSRLIARIMLISAVALVAVVLFGASNIKDRWLTPIYLVLPLYLCLKIEAAGFASERQLKRFQPIGLTLMVLIPLVLFVRIPLHGQLGKYEKLNVPYEAAVAQILSSEPNPPSLILASDQQMAGNIRLNAPDDPGDHPRLRGLRRALRLRCHASGSGGLAQSRPRDHAAAGRRRPMACRPRQPTGRRDEDHRPALYLRARGRPLPLRLRLPLSAGELRGPWLFQSLMITG